MQRCSNLASSTSPRGHGDRRRSAGSRTADLSRPSDRGNRKIGCHLDAPRPWFWLEPMTRERSMPWTPTAAVVARRSSARCPRTGPVEWRPAPYGEASLRSLTQPTNDRDWREPEARERTCSVCNLGEERTRLNRVLASQVDPAPPSRKTEKRRLAPRLLDGRAKG